MKTHFPRLSMALLTGAVLSTLHPAARADAITGWNQRRRPSRPPAHRARPRRPSTPLLPPLTTAR